MNPKKRIKRGLFHGRRSRPYHLSEQCVCVHTNTLVRDTLIPVKVRNTVKHTIQKHFRFSKEDAENLKIKSQKACLSESQLIRLLIRGYKPKEKPDDRFYEAMRQLSGIANNINQLAAKAHSLGFVDAQKLKDEVVRWHQFQADIERQFLRPEDDRKRWQ